MLLRRLATLALVLIPIGACEETGTGGEGGGAAGGMGGMVTGGSGGMGLGGSGGSVPLTCDADVTNAESGPCDILAQDCDPGYGCKLVGLGSPPKPKCVAQPGLKTIGQSCPTGQDDECLAGLICRGLICTAYCCPSTDLPCNGGACSTLDQAGSGITAFICNFDEQCALFNPDSCPAGKDCHVADPTQGLATCSTTLPGQSAEGEACMYINDCPDSLDCFNGICRYYCHHTAPESMNAPGLGGCPPGRTCAMVDLGIPDVGICLP